MGMQIQKNEGSLNFLQDKAILKVGQKYLQELLVSKLDEAL